MNPLRERASRPADSPLPAPLRLLLVDDHPLVRDGLRARLEPLDGLIVVGEAGSGGEALDLVAELRPHQVLTDVGMKGIGGIELAVMLSERWPEVQVLMLSMYDNPEYVQRSLEAGARAYILKEAPAEEIIAAIRAVAAGGTFLSPAVSQRLFRGQPRPLLTPRESEVLAALARGESSKQIARDLGLSVRTVETHRQHIKRRLGLEGRAELIRYAVEHVRRFGDSG